MTIDPEQNPPPRGCGEQPAAREGRSGSGSGGREPAPLILALRDVRDDDLSLVGGKGMNLSLLIRDRLPVPPGFCVTTASFRLFLDAHPNSGERAQTGFIGKELPREVERAVLGAWHDQGEGLNYAVRSSATVEDAADRSFAGQFETCLNVHGRDALLEAITRCWRSLYSARSLAYHARERRRIDQAAMAVVVQEMVPAEVAGVLFTVDPLLGTTNRLIIEGAPGLGDRLVSGQVAPDRVILEKPGLRVLQRSSATESTCLDDSLSRQLGELALKAERRFGGPLDLEWAAAGSRVYLLQARPITGTPRAKSPKDRQIWINVNAGEVMPDVTTPMTWSFILYLLKPLLRSVIRLVGAEADRVPVVGLVAGRAYFNANSGLAAMKPFWSLLRRLPNLAQALGGGPASEFHCRLLEIPDTHLPDLGFRWHKYILSWPRILRDLIRHSPRRGDAWTASLRSHSADHLRADLESMSTPELAAFFNQRLNTQCEGWDLLYLVTQAAVLPLFQKACHDWLDDPNLTLGYRLFAGLGGIPEVEAGLALWRLALLAHADPSTEKIIRSEDAWPNIRSRLDQLAHGRRFLDAWTAFMAEHGHHCRGELELCNPRWSETPEYILNVLRGYLDAHPRLNPLVNQPRLTEERLRLTAQCRAQLRNPIQRWLFSAALTRAQKLAVNREVWKDQAVRMILLLRRILLVLGQRLCEQGVISARDDIFFLEVSEVAPVASGQSGFNHRERIQSRRLEYDANLRESPPAVVVGTFRAGATAASEPRHDGRSTVIEGIPVSPGVVTGLVRVILRSNDHEQVLPGEILVAPFTDPAWTPYFLTAAGVIMEQGGILSHGSIVAREFGLPAVTNLESATRLLRTGDRIHLDANLGRVTVLERVSTPAR